VQCPKCGQPFEADSRESTAAATPGTTVQNLTKVVLDTISAITANLDPEQASLLGSKAAIELSAAWSRLERRVCAAKLAIVRDEFRVRFPSLDIETEHFTFGITDGIADRYIEFLVHVSRMIFSK
jgi:hypothetical protein